MTDCWCGIGDYNEKGDHCSMDHGIHQFYTMIDVNTKGIDLDYCVKCGKKKPTEEIE